MKKMKLLALVMFMTLSASPLFATKTSITTNSTAKDASLTKEEVSVLTSRVEEIRDMDKSNLSASEKSDLKNELKDIKSTMKSDPYIYIGGSTLIVLIIVLIIIL